MARKGLLNLHRKNRRLSMRDSNKTTTLSKRESTPRMAEDVELILPTLKQNRQAVQPSGSKSARQAYEPKPRQAYEPKPVTVTLDYKNSEYLERHELEPLPDADRQFKALFATMKESADWHQQFEAVNTLRRLVENHEELVTKSGSSSIHLLVLELLRMVESLRSSVSKNAMIALGELTAKARRALDPDIEAITDRLLRKVADANTFISEEARRALITLATHLSENKVLQVVAQHRDSKTVPVKEALIAMLAAMIQNDKILRKEHARIAELLVHFLGEGQLELRSKARTAILEMCRGLDGWQGKLKSGLSSESYRTVLELQARESDDATSFRGTARQESPTRESRREEPVPSSPIPIPIPFASEIRRKAPKVSVFPQ